MSEFENTEPEVHENAPVEAPTFEPFEPEPSADPATDDHTASLEPEPVTKNEPSDTCPEEPAAEVNDNTDENTAPNSDLAPGVVPFAVQPDPEKVAAKLDDPAQQRDPNLQIAKNEFIAGQDYDAATVICPVCQAEFNPGTPVL